MQLSFTSQKEAKKTTKKGLIFQFSAHVQPSLIFSFFLQCFRDETRLARLCFSLSLFLSPPPLPECALARSLAISRPRVSLPRCRRCCPGNVSFHHLSALRRGSGGKKRATRGGFGGVEVGVWSGAGGGAGLPPRQNTKGAGEVAGVKRTRPH